VASPAAAESLDTLTPLDLEVCAVWQLTLHDKVAPPNRGRVRARPDLVRYDEAAETGVYAVRTRFDLACGDSFIGYSTPISDYVGPEEHRLGYFSPAIATDKGQVSFWHVVEEEPAPGWCRHAYDLLGRAAHEVFPVTWRTDVASVDGVHHDGRIDAFHFLVHESGAFRLVLRT
jgi:hypothetical protein